MAAKSSCGLLTIGITSGSISQAIRIGSLIDIENQSQESVVGVMLLTLILN